MLCPTLSAKTVKVGVEDIDYFPHLSFGYHENSYAQQVLTKFFAEQGIKVVFVPLPVKRFNDWFLTKEVDFKYPDNPVWRSNEKHGIDIHYSTPLTYSISGVIRTKENLGKPFDQIHLVGTLVGFFPQLWSEHIRVGKVAILEESTPKTVVQLPLKGLVDAIGLDYSVVNFHLGQLQQQGQLLMDPSLPTTKVGFSLSTIDQVATLEAFNRFIADNAQFLQALQKDLGMIADPIAFTQQQIN